MRFSKRLFERRSKFMVAATSIVLMLGFIGISGASPSMVRAGIVAGLSLLAWYYGRVFHPMLLILYVAAATAYWQPSYEWSDIGWWLSFLAFFGVLIVSPLVMKLLYRDRKPGALWQIIGESIAARHDAAAHFDGVRIVTCSGGCCQYCKRAAYTDCNAVNIYCGSFCNGIAGSRASYSYTS